MEQARDLGDDVGRHLRVEGPAVREGEHRPGVAIVEVGERVGAAVPEEVRVRGCRCSSIVRHLAKGLSADA